MNIQRVFSASLVFGMVGATLLLSAQDANAGTHDPGVNERQEKQQHRIDQGVKNGELTKREARHLETRQRHIDKTEQRFKADGDLTKTERAKLHKMEDKSSQAIYRQKHDAQAHH